MVEIKSIYIPIFFTIMEYKKNKQWDKEYLTSFYDEVLWLRSHGIRYTWVTKNEYGISVWKYKKTHELWESLAEMYKNQKYEI